MPSLRLLNQGGTGPYLRRARYLLAAVMVCVFLLVPYVIVRAFQVDAHLNATRLEVSDNETWVVAQLEVDYLKLALAVHEIDVFRPNPVSMASELLPTINTRFDIFYSRLETVANKIRTWSTGPGTWDKSLRILDRLMDDRDQIAAILDGANTPAGSLRLPELDALIASTAVHVRDLSTSTLSNLSVRSADRRQHYLSELRGLLVQTISMLLVVALTSLAAFVLYRQIAARAAAEHRLSENLFRVFDAKPDAILLTGSDDRIIGLNRAAADLFGLTEDAAEGLHALDCFFPGVRRRSRSGRPHPLTDPNTARQSLAFRDIVRGTGGRTVAAEITRIPLMSKSGTDTIALFIRDISQTQQALRALRRERHLAETEAVRYQRFLAVMSHEIRSPLHAIIASLDLARQRPEAAALADLHTIAMDAAQVALEEADEVLAIGRAQHEMRTADPVVFSPAEMVRDLIEMNGPAAHSAGTVLAVEIGPGAEGAVLGLRACFWHAVSNLIGNAVKFTRNGTVRVCIRRQGETLHVEVADDGPGIAPEMQARIFADHYTHEPVPGRRGKGAGLGLGLFVAAVEAMSGDYGLDSTPGQGSTFWFAFPAPPATRPAATPAPAPSDLAPLPLHLAVLVVDDAQVNRTLIRQMFLALGLSVDLAGSGPEAIAAARTKAYDLILMDLSMPQMDGFAAAAAIRQAGASQAARIIALTANILARAEVDKPGSAFDGLWLKPLRLDELRRALSADLPQPRTATSAEPLVDPGIARDLLDMLPVEAIRPLLSTLFDETADLARDLAAGGAEASLSKRFHRIAGSAGMLGANRLRALALAGEVDCKTGRTSPSPAFCAAWQATLDQTSRDWDQRLAERTEAATEAIER